VRAAGNACIPNHRDGHSAGRAAAGGVLRCGAGAGRAGAGPGRAGPRGTPSAARPGPPCCPTCSFCQSLTGSRGGALGQEDRGAARSTSFVRAGRACSGRSSLQGRWTRKAARRRVISCQRRDVPIPACTATALRSFGRWDLAVGTSLPHPRHASKAPAAGDGAAWSGLSGRMLTTVDSRWALGCVLGNGKRLRECRGRRSFPFLRTRSFGSAAAQGPRGTRYSAAVALSLWLKKAIFLLQCYMNKCSFIWMLVDNDGDAAMK
jgi:hypothetical protein